MNLRRRLATSEHWIAVRMRRLYHGSSMVSLPTHPLLVRLVLGFFLLIRSLYYFLLRVLICEPLLKAYCTRHGKSVHTGVFIPWIGGAGEIILGNNVRIHGKFSLNFAARFCDRPTLIVGDKTGIGHDCNLVIGRRITIGRNCLIAQSVWMFDSSGHSSDPCARLAGLPPKDDEVKPITIADNVWIGGKSIIFPGVTVGEGSVIAAGSIVMSDVAPYTVVAGNPARRIGTLNPPASVTLIEK